MMRGKDVMNVYMTLGRRVRLERKRHGWTQELLAQKARLSMAFIGQIERGTNVASLVSLEKIAKALGLSVRNLLVTRKETRKASSTTHHQIASLINSLSQKDQKYVHAVIKALLRKRR